MTITWMMLEVVKVLGTLLIFTAVFCATFYMGYKVGQVVMKRDNDNPLR